MIKDIEKSLADLIQSKVKQSLEKSGKLPKKEILNTKSVIANSLNESLVATPGSFVVKTQKLSRATKESHENLYKKYVDTFNKVSSELDGVNKHEAGSYASLYRAFKIDECYNLNAIKLHELYFLNISDLASEIAIDSLPYIRFSRDFGTFENWQFDFIACAMSSREGWAITVYEPYKNVYMNVCVDGHTNGIPVGTVPVLVLDMWSHSFFKDYEIDKKSYIISMMKETNWDVVEARMTLADRSDLNALYHIRPLYNDTPEKLLAASKIDTNAPITQIVNNSNNNVINPMVAPTTPPMPLPASPTIYNHKGIYEKK